VSGWNVPAGPRACGSSCAAPGLAPGEQPTLFHADGYKYSCFATNTGPGLSVQLLDARHRAHARVEDRVRTAKDTGLGHMPSKSWTVNLAWCHAVAIAVDLLAWLKLLGCPDIRSLAKAEPATLRYRLLHVPARLVRRQRIRWLRVPRSWPWAADLARTFDRIRALPTPNTG
jgi:Transposase DDE domain group 1